MPSSFGFTLPKLKNKHKQCFPLSTVSHHLSVKSCVGDALDAEVLKGSAAGLGLVLVLGRSRGTGGGGGLRDGNTQERGVPLLQSSSNALDWLPNEFGPTDFDFPFTPKSSSSSKVTHPFGLLVFIVDWPCRSKLSLKQSCEDEGLLVFWPKGIRERKGLFVTVSSLDSHEVASDSWDWALNGFPGTAVLSVKGFVLVKLVINGFGELRIFSWDLLRAGIAGMGGMQLTELTVLTLLCVAEGNWINLFGSRVRTGDVWTDGWAFDTASRLNDRSSNGSLFDSDSCLTLESPFVFTCSCGEDSEGKLWEDLLRGGGWGGVSKFGWGPGWGTGAAMGMRGSCNFWAGGGRDGCTGKAAWGFSGSGRRVEPFDASGGLLWLSGVSLPADARAWLWGALITPARGGIVGLAVLGPAGIGPANPAWGEGWLRPGTKTLHPMFKY